ncbi:hypothetical protein ASPWEDRAFT_589829 [Aspergillus wentii DTO 134E9]|uniref:DRBM domain-containing protein n=1 Tax=Aspergillus wentii DTO 134E9 TaxID=1073089 RepID=A0A1L9RCY0_ASPWE|nr:uncharacterized protein ASPWEDRAFT_589829 [Aspergillus wentii DTO 134E9]OJJ32723.1 hypothetical protein ASPWEDRAFT_589829 [Aspergillus wentii DTO 134E9]
MVTQQSTNATAIWLGHNWMQLFLASWVSRNNPPDTPVSQLKHIYTNIETALPFPDLCRILALKYRFPGCGNTPQEDLYLFLGRVYEESPQLGSQKLDNVQLMLDQYLSQRTWKPSVASTPMVSSTPLASTPLTAPSLYSTPPANVLDQSSALQTVREEAARSVSGSASVSGSVSASVSAGPASLPELPSDLARFTSSLKARGDVEGVKPVYEEVMLRETPPDWQSIGNYNGITGVGRGTTKKEARHLASREIWNSL